MESNLYVRCGIARRAKGLSQHQAAELLNTGVRNLRRYEMENRDSLDMYLRMAAVYECSFNWLVKNEGPFKPDESVTLIMKTWNTFPAALREGLIRLAEEIGRKNA